MDLAFISLSYISRSAIAVLFFKKGEKKKRVKNSLLVGGGGTSLAVQRWHSGKESACQCKRHRRCGFDPWVEKIPWSRKWQPTPVFLPGKSHGRRSLAGYSPQGHKELDTTVQLTHTYTQGTKGLPRWCSGKESTYQEENAGSVPGLGRSPGMASHSSTPVWEIP